MKIPNRNSLYSMIIIAVFLLSISVPLGWAILQEDRGLSYSEKRKLEQLPALPRGWSDLPDYIADFEKYYNDQFGLREYFLTKYASLKKMLGDQDSSRASENIGTKNIIEGKEGWFFLNRKWDGDPVSDYRNIHLYSEAELLRSTLLFAARTHRLKRQGVEYLIFFAPNKHTIYSEYLPDYITKIGDISAMDQLFDSLRRNTDVHFVDLRQVLQDGKGEAVKYWSEQQEKAALYYRKDSHWNAAGVDIAQYEVALKLEQIFPGKIRPRKRPPGDFVMRRFVGDITLIMGGKEKEAFGPHLEGGLCTEEGFLDYLERHHVTVCEKNEIDAVVFNDSFMPPVKLYLTDYFRRTVYHWESMTLARLRETMKINRPDIVIEQRAERFMPFTPRAYSETYSGFWKMHWRKWKKNIYQMEFSTAEKQLRGENVIFGAAGDQGGLAVTAQNPDPQILLPRISFQQGKMHMARVQLTSERATRLQLYYGENGVEEKFPTEHQSVSIPVKKGRNDLYLPLYALNLDGRLRLDPGKKAGRYVLHELTVKELEEINVKEKR